MTTTPAPSIAASLLTGTSTGPFPTGFKYNAAEDVRVWLELAGIRQPDLTLTTDYTLTGATPLVDGGTVTLDSDVVPEAGWNAAAGDRIVIARRTVKRQALALPDTEGHRPRATEQALDKLMRAAEELAGETARSMMSPVGEGGLQIPRLADRANSVFAFDAEGRADTSRSLTAFDADVAQVAADREATNADRLATTADRAATGQDRVQTGLDRLAAEAAAADAIIVSGVNVPIYDTLASATAGLILPGVNVIVTRGFASAGDGGGATWKRVASEPAHLGGKFSNGGWWQYVPGAEVNAHVFGVVADATFNQTTGVMTGTDSAQALQNAIDFGMYFVARPIAFHGDIRTTKPLHLGYGDRYLKGLLRGDGKSSAVDLPASKVFCDFDHGMGINLQGGRASALIGVTFIGRNFRHAATNRLASVEGVPLNGYDDRVMADWIDPALPATANARYTPYAAVVIDGYSGPAPGTPYPVVTYPAWTGLGTTQYGKNPSSNVLIDDCGFLGWVGAVAVQPVDFDGNGDFIRVRDCYGTRLAWVYSIGNTQCRNFESVDNTWHKFHSGFVTGLHGRQNGRISGVSTNDCFAECINVVSVANDGIAGPLVITATYGEEVWRLGDWGGGAASGSGIIWVNPLFSFGLQGAHARGVPVTLLGGAGGSTRTFDGGSLQVHDLIPLSGAPRQWSIRGTSVVPLDDTPLTETYEQIARNWTAGGFMFTAAIAGVQGDWPSHFSPKPSDTYNLVTGDQAGTLVFGEHSASSRRRGLSAWSRYAFSVNHPGEGQHCPPQAVTIDLANAAVVSSAVFGTDGVLTVTFIGRTDAEFAHAGGEPGDIFQIGNTVFKVFSRVGQVVEAMIANNFEVVGGVYSIIGAGVSGGEAVNLATGLLSVYNTRRFLPSHYTLGDISSSSSPTKITDVGRDDGFATYIGTEVLADDWVHVDPQVDAWTSLANSKVTAVDATAREITLNGAVARTRTRWPLPFIVRKPPANL